MILQPSKMARLAVSQSRNAFRIRNSLKQGSIAAPKGRFYHSSTSSLLKHEHLSQASFTPYETAETIQEQYRTLFLGWKSHPEEARSRLQCPRPHLLSFESTPTFTLGRRQEPLTEAQLSRLKQPLSINLPRYKTSEIATFSPVVKHTNRGGLTTYHGPGQLVFWPVLDMHSPLYAKFGVATYAAHLENTTQRLLYDIFGIKTYTNHDEPGVWVKASSSQPRKIAALGVHHRRYVTALGIAVNIDIPVTGDEAVNPWARFIPCGLEGKLVTSVISELGQQSSQSALNMEDIAKLWAVRFEEGLLDITKREFIN